MMISGYLPIYLVYHFNSIESDPFYFFKSVCDRFRFYLLDGMFMDHNNVKSEKKRISLFIQRILAIRKREIFGPVGSETPAG